MMASQRRTIFSDQSLTWCIHSAPQSLGAFRFAAIEKTWSRLDPGVRSFCERIMEQTNACSNLADGKCSFRHYHRCRLDRLRGVGRSTTFSCWYALSRPAGSRCRRRSRYRRRTVFVSRSGSGIGNWSASGLCERQRQGREKRSERNEIAGVLFQRDGCIPHRRAD
jgi:hypothetical protein